MGLVLSIFQDDMAAIFFFYGLSFMILAAVLFFKLRKSEKTYLTRPFWLLFWFALLHALQEWSDMTQILIGASNTLFVISLLAGTISFAFLLQFGIALLLAYNEKFNAGRNMKILKFAVGIPVGTAIMYLLLAFYPMNHFSVGFRNIGRFTFGFLGAAFSTFALSLFYRRIGCIIPTKTKLGLVLLILAFSAYTIFGGLITVPIFKIPVQLFRMICALLAGIGIYLMLDIFELVKLKKIALAKNRKRK